ncbi:hypothetical protein E0Z10_g6229 [Xylaria hypoxylon]|uniref:Suppressor of anucleate metulae protein B n=1 Tax=Xylaria hypoxylon TaxID=37992 RepID=A0A4Z0Z1M1_9PEZI|nr:hypothetical protein E0Z10_g6229 [Xylaria hypoxylon]
MDSVEKMFQGFADPEVENVAGAKESAVLFNKALAQFLKDPPSEDPDYEYLLTHAKQAFAKGEPTINYFCQQLCYLAVQKPLNRKDKSAKARHLKYYRWFGFGMKKEAYPFTVRKPPGHPSTARIAALISPTSCTACGKANANMRCPDCTFQDDRHIVEKTAYCNKQCLTDHHDTHKPICNGRIMVYRAVLLLEFIFMAMEESTYVYPLGDLQTKHGVVYLLDEDWDRVGMTGRRIFVPFPKSLTDSPDLRRALLLWGQSEEIGLSLFDLINYIFKPFCKSIEQVFVHPRNVLTPICYLSEERALSICLYRHTVLRLTLRSGEKYVIDLTGAQFGWKEILAPWLTWTSLRSARTDSQVFKRASGNIKAAFLNSALESQQHEARAVLTKSIAEGLINTLRTNTNHRSFDELLKSDTEDYKRVEFSIMEMVRQKVYMVITNEFYKDPYRLWLGCDSRFGIYLAKNQSKTLKKLWMSTKEYDRLKASGEDMRKVWAERFDTKIRENLAKETVEKKDKGKEKEKEKEKEKPSHEHEASKKTIRNSIQRRD